MGIQDKRLYLERRKANVTLCNLLTKTENWIHITAILALKDQSYTYYSKLTLYQLFDFEENL